MYKAKFNRITRTHWQIYKNDGRIKDSFSEIDYESKKISKGKIITVSREKAKSYCQVDNPETE